MRPRALVSPFRRLRPERGIDPIRAARAELAELAAGSGPVVAGPWLAEVGYELLYWIPFLRWAVEREPSLRARLSVVSRGGVSSWYDGIASSYVEIYETLAPEELERLRDGLTAETAGSRKQLGRTSLDEQVLAAVGIEPEAPVLHPSLMFAVFRQMLKRSTLRPKDLPFRHALLRDPALELDLPERFVAVRFYYRASFPETPENQRFVAASLARLSSEGDVVTLDAHRSYDDHVDATVPPGLVRPPELDDPQTNLAVQTSVLARAEAFVGTYGGLSYLAPLLGVPAVAYHSDAARFRPQHLELAHRVFRDPPFGRLVALGTDEAGLLDRVLPRSS
jgi:hypothetical protein